MLMGCVQKAFRRQRGDDGDAFQVKTATAFCHASVFAWQLHGSCNEFLTSWTWCLTFLVPGVAFHVNVALSRYEMSRL